MEYVIPVLISILLSIILAYAWVKGIDYMEQNHKDYKGEDMFED